MLNLRLFLAILAAKITFFFCRILGKSGGTAAPGLVAQKINPQLLFHFSRQFKKGTILITGTNGKTTTARLVSHLLKSAKIPFIHNRTGSNLARGLVSACLEKSSLSGRINADWGVFELDEAAFSLLAPCLHPKIVVILNLFRDQLDRYGEIDTILKNWQKTLKKLASKTTIILNGDDPSVASLGQPATQKVIYFGFNDPKIGQLALSHASDATSCPHCFHHLIYQSCYLSHLGVYRCPQCGPIQPVLDFSAQQIKKTSLDSFSFVFKTAGQKLCFSLPLPGLYNLYNALAALAVSREIGLDLKNTPPLLKKFVSPFGRIEKVKTKTNQFLQILLVKNPAGFNEVLRTLQNRKGKFCLLIAINDLIADGQDVSWLWDVDFEMMTAKTKNILFSGLRAEDMALRWQYAGGKTAAIEKNFSQALEKGLGLIKKGETVFVLPTYTAMLEIRQTLHKMGLVHETWQD